MKVESALESLNLKSIHAAPPMLNNFPNIANHACADVYLIFGFEPMHALFFGDGRLLKECFHTFSGDREKKICSKFKNALAYEDVFEDRKKFLCSMNRFWTKETKLFWMTSTSWLFQKRQTIVFIRTIFWKRSNRTTASPRHFFCLPRFLIPWRRSWHDMCNSWKARHNTCIFSLLCSRKAQI